MALFLVVLGTSRAAAKTLAVHGGGRVEMGIIGRGSLAGAADGSYTAANFYYPANDPDVRPFLAGYSEIWVGTKMPPIAGVVELTPEGRLATGEWAVASFGNPRVIASPVPGMGRIAARYQAKLSDTFTVLVEQDSTSWSDPKAGESNGVVLKLVLTNLGELSQKGVYVALATNWDVDAAVAQAGNPNLDMVFWDAVRRASVVYDGSPSDGTTPIHVASVLLEGNLQAHRVIAVPQTPWTFTDEQRASVFTTQVVQEQTTLPANYFTALVAGPFDLEGKNAVTATFALVGGESREKALANVDAVRRAASRPELVRTEAVEGGVRVVWTPPVVSDVVGYALFRATSPGGTFEQIGSRIIAGTEFTDTTVAEGTAYFYRVNAVDSAERVVDAPSAVVAGATGPKPPTIPTLKASVDSGPHGPVVRISFSDKGYAASATKIALYRNETGQEPWTLIQTLDFTTSLTDAEVASGKTYYYAARLVSDVGRFGDLSEPTEVVVPTATAPLAADLSKIVVAPNPVRKGIVRFLNLPARVTISIYAPSGEQIARLDSFDAPTVAWEPDSSVASGVYLYQVQRVPEATSAGAEIAPSGGELQSVYGKIAVLR